ncbi:hypothetical protein [Maritimibacter sp. 55A14]|uniref:hypothetical protein n=1 Tax=Maritimibacter sp. 55A14 TaxID=2174844 RepID=UPI0011B27EA5|nr:hypothetical protein [Maritimibacter sp. 55A14]
MAVNTLIQLKKVRHNFDENPAPFSAHISTQGLLIGAPPEQISRLKPAGFQSRNNSAATADQRHPPIRSLDRCWKKIAGIHARLKNFGGGGGGHAGPCASPPRTGPRRCCKRDMNPGGGPVKFARIRTKNRFTSACECV